MDNPEILMANTPTRDVHRVRYEANRVSRVPLIRQHMGSPKSGMTVEMCVYICLHVCMSLKVVTKRQHVSRHSMFSLYFESRYRFL